MALLLLKSRSDALRVGRGIGCDETWIGPTGFRRRCIVLVEEMTIEECRRTMSTASFGRLASAHDGQPYVLPISFSMDGDYAYVFSMPGQKVEWMRLNPRVCLEVDSVKAQDEWTSVVALGRYEELSDTPERRPELLRAQQVLQRRTMWWQPGATIVASAIVQKDAAPVLYRICVERMTGRRGRAHVGRSFRRPPSGFS